MKSKSCKGCDIYKNYIYIYIYIYIYVYDQQEQNVLNLLKYYVLFPWNGAKAYIINQNFKHFYALSTHLVHIL